MRIAAPVGLALTLLATPFPGPVRTPERPPVDGRPTTEAPDVSASREGYPPQGGVTLGAVTWVTDGMATVPFVEPHLAINPTDPSNMVAAAVGYPAPGTERILIFYTRDGGATWAEGGLGDGLPGVDPWLAFDPAGTVSLVALPATLRVSRDGGATWARRDTTALARQLLDYPKSTFVPSRNGPGRLAVWVAGGLTRRGGLRVGPLHLFLVPATDDAETVYRREAPGAINYQVGAIGALEDGTLVAPFHELTARSDFLENPRLWIARFDAGGDALHPPVLVTEGFAADSPDIATGPDPNGGAERVYLSWMGLSSDRSTWNHVVAASGDGGVVWGEPVALVEDGGTERYMPHHPMIAVDGTGVVGATFKAPAPGGSSGDRCFAFFFTASADGGETFLPPVEVGPETCADLPGNRVAVAESEGAATVVRRFGDGGDYHGLVGLPGGGFRAVWSDSRTGVYQLYSVEIAVR